MGLVLLDNQQEQSHIYLGKERLIRLFSLINTDTYSKGQKGLYDWFSEIISKKTDTQSNYEQKVDVTGSPSRNTDIYS